jgi:hypothetical protein
VTATKVVTATKLYLAGPMSNIPGYNFPAFEEATAELRAQGYEVISPAEQDKLRDPTAYELASKSPDGKWNPAETGGLTWAEVLSKDVVIVADKVDGVALLPGWETSSGARLEAFVGLLRKKRFAIYHPEFKQLKFVSNDYIREIIRGNMP